MPVWDEPWIGCRETARQHMSQQLSYQPQRTGYQQQYQPQYQPQTQMGQQFPSGQTGQQLEQPGQQPGQFGQQLGQSSQQLGQSGQQLGQFGQAVGRRFQEGAPAEVQSAVQSLDRLETVCEWAKTQATQRGMARLARACDDIQDIAHLQKKLIIRQSPFAQPIGNASRQVIQNAVQELQQHVNQPEVQEALSEAQQTVNSINNALTRLQSGTSQQQQQQQGWMGP